MTLAKARANKTFIVQSSLIVIKIFYCTGPGNQILAPEVMILQLNIVV
jgi:hypothetical protein